MAQIAPHSTAIALEKVAQQLDDFTGRKYMEHMQSKLSDAVSRFASGDGSAMKSVLDMAAKTGQTQYILPMARQILAQNKQDMEDRRRRRSTRLALNKILPEGWSERELDMLADAPGNIQSQVVANALRGRDETADLDPVIDMALRRPDSFKLESIIEAKDANDPSRLVPVKDDPLMQAWKGNSFYSQLQRLTGAGNAAAMDIIYDIDRDPSERMSELSQVFADPQYQRNIGPDVTENELLSLLEHVPQENVTAYMNTGNPQFIIDGYRGDSVGLSDVRNASQLAARQIWTDFMKNKDQRIGEAAQALGEEGALREDYEELLETVGIEGESRLWGITKSVPGPQEFVRVLEGIDSHLESLDEDEAKEFRNRYRMTVDKLRRLQLMYHNPDQYLSYLKDQALSGLLGSFNEAGVEVGADPWAVSGRFGGSGGSSQQPSGDGSTTNFSFDPNQGQGGEQAQPQETTTPPRDEQGEGMEPTKDNIVQSISQYGAAATAAALEEAKYDESKIRELMGQDYVPPEER